MKKRYFAFILLLVIGGVVLVQAPAAWLAPLVANATQDTLRFEKSWGTVWNGQAQLAVQRSKTEQLRLPGELGWRFNGWALLGGKLDAQLTVQGQTLPLKGHFFGAQAALAVPAGRYDLPASSLNTLGAPFNTLKLQGAVQAQWAAFHLPLKGVFNPPALELTVQQLQTRVTGPWVLGSYTLAVPARARGQALTFQLRTLNPLAPELDPLQLSAQGTLKPDGTPQFELRAGPATEPQRERLQALLNLLGRREGGVHVLRM